MAMLSGRLRRYSEKCVSDRLDEDFAKAVQEAADLIEEIEYPEIITKASPASLGIYTKDGET